MNRNRISKGIPVKITGVRPLVEADLELLRQPSERTRLQNIRDSHHVLARCLAAGLSLAEIAERTGYAINRISILSHDPAMVELIAHYRNLLTEDWRAEQLTITDYIAHNTLAALRQQKDRLDEADARGETLPMRELIALSTDGMDRLGPSKKTANLNINVDFAAKLEAAIARTRKVAAE